MATGRHRRIIHVDMDAFYSAIEQLDHPEYRGKPVVVGADPKEGRGRGVVSTASYEARKFGIGSAMPVSEAYRRCPHAIFTPPRFKRYGEMSRIVMHTLQGFSPAIQKISIDEAFMDCSGTEGIYQSTRELGEKIKLAVREATQLSCSVGIATTKSIAKVASDLDKPDGLTICPPGKEKEFLAPLDVSRLWGAGKKTIAKLHSMGMYKIGDVANFERGLLESSLGKMGTHLWQLAHGIDPRPVDTGWGRKSISKERTYFEDRLDDSDIEESLFWIADELAREMREECIKGRTITVKIRLTGFETFTRSKTLPRMTDRGAALRETALELYRGFNREGRGVRLIGIGVSNLDLNEPDKQQGLFDDLEKQGDAKAKVETVLDDMRKKFGNEIQRGTFIDRKEDPVRFPKG